jgi:small conductance mechanosensitive channel
MPQPFINFFNRLGNFALYDLLPVVIILAIGILVIQIAMKIVSGLFKKTKLEPAAASLLKGVLRGVLYLLLGLIVASRLGINVTSIVALASVLTLAVSLAVQSALTNLIGGFTLLHTKPFVVDDFVEIAGQSGTVKGIGLTYTKLATADNKIVSIPNSSVVATEIVNYTVSGTRRVDIAISASYDCPVDKVMEALLEAAQVPTALDTPAPFTAVKNYGESAIEYVLQVWCTSGDYWATLFTVNQRVQSIFMEKGISMTYPHLNVHLDK